MPLPVISVAQMREWENRTWAAGQTQEAVIERAGLAVAQAMLGIVPPGSQILVLAGLGHNGDDARVAARHLPDREATVLDVADPALALLPFTEWLGRQTQARASRPGYILDGLFGIGLNRPLEGAWIELLDAINRADVPVISVDVPSGLDAGTGKPLGAAIRASVTITLGAPKTGLVRTEATDFTGRLVVAPDIGLISCPFDSELQWTESCEFKEYPPGRPVTWHKGRSGHLGIVAGSTGYHGAAVLAALGAQKAQPGLVTLLVPEQVYVPVASQLRQTMVRPWQPGVIEVMNFDAILFGPGLAGDDVPGDLKDELIKFWQVSPVSMVADASGLDWLPPGATEPPEALRVLTPHPGEATRLLNCTPVEVQEDRLKALRGISRGWGNCHVVLKGYQTLIGRSEGPVYINPSGNPFLAQGGAGDLLAGFMAGLLAQPSLANSDWGGDPMKTIRYAVWRHGDRADVLNRTRSHWTVDDLSFQL